MAGDNAHIEGLDRPGRRTELLRSKAFNALETRVETLEGGLLVGEIKMLGFTTIPTGWLLCDGSAVSRTTYADLFAAIGTSFGVGDGSTTFNLPSLTTTFPRGNTTVGGTGGSANAIVVAHTHTMPSHNHSIDPPNTSTSSDTHNHSYYAAGVNKFVGNAIQTDAASVRSYTTTTNDTHSHTVNIAAFDSSTVDPGDTNSSGSSGTNANLPPYLDVVFAIYAG